MFAAREDRIGDTRSWSTHDGRGKFATLVLLQHLAGDVRHCRSSAAADSAADRQPGDPPRLPRPVGARAAILPSEQRLVIEPPSHRPGSIVLNRVHPVFEWVAW